MDDIDPSLAASESVARAAAQRESLAPGTRLGDFEIMRTLGIGGFGTVYLARDRLLERDVAVKEYLPAQLAFRAEGLQVEVRSPSMAAAYAAGLTSFVNEAKILARFNHPAVVKVHRFWEANGTAYMVMPWVRGPTLREVRRAMKAPPTEAWLRGLVDPLLDALALLHAQGIYHRDIAPDNILLPAPHDPVLLDFGAARRVIGNRTETLTAVLKPSFAPIEQYAEASQLRQGPWTDLYALGAVVVYMLTAVPPAPSTVRTVHDEPPIVGDPPPPGVSENFLAAVRWALAVRPQDRPQSVQEFRNALDGLIAPPVGVPRDHGLRLGALEPVRTAPQWLAEAARAPAASAPAAGATHAPGGHTAHDARADAPGAAASAAAQPEPGAPAWAPTIRLTAPPARPVMPAPLVKPPRRAPPLAIAIAGVAAAVLAGGIAFSLLHRGPVEPPLATWRALGQQAATRAEKKPVVEEVIEEREAPPPAAEPPHPVTLAPALPERPALRPVSAMANGDEARPTERRAPALSRLSMSGTHAARAGDKRAVGASSRKGGGASTRASAAAQRLETGPREACGDRSILGMAICVNRQCESPRFMHHPYCVDLRRQWQERRMRGEHP